jgi:hypothetical protein
MNPRILVLAAGVVVGYIVGTRAGRERYDEMKAAASKLWQNPRVRKVRTDVEAYARQQAPVIRERAEAAAKAAPAVIADGAKAAAEVAKDVAEKTGTVARDVAEKTGAVAKDVAGKTSSVAKDVAQKTGTVAKDVAQKTGTVAKDVADRSTVVAKDVADRTKKTAADVRERGEAVVDRAVAAVGEARDDALHAFDDADDPGSTR